MRILLTGKSGQIGGELEARLAPMGELIAPGRAELEFLDLRALQQEVRSVRPTLIVNAAAYTAVDRAESERDAAFAVNAAAVGVLAEEAKKLGALLVHFSTDYVFDGEKAGPYNEDDAARPVSVYGESKLAGERAVAGSGCRYLIFRTSWVYSARGRNFARAILAAARANKALRVVDDQRGAPTPAHAVAEAVVRALRDKELSQKTDLLYHLSMAGETTWHGFACEILRGAGLERPVAAISSAEYGAAARRPGNSLLDNSRLERTFGFALPHWRAGLAALLPAIH
ncbi:MAG TPA: dTDP-4-dehydrorhamnose reductase [Burkholderiales bacterium]|nr:dTDP-4-dehydrorhamnose reductase [Burkholderiales bacterium]